MKKNCKIFFLFLFSALGNNVNAQNLMWAKQFSGASGCEQGYSVAVDASGNVYTTGMYDNSTDFDPGPGTYFMNCASIDFCCFVSKLDALGNFIWAKQLGEGSLTACRGWSIAVDDSGNVYTTGDFIGIGDFDPGSGTYNLVSGNASSDIFISKLDSSGNFVWAKDIGGTSYNDGFSIKVDNNGNVYTTGDLQGTADFDPGPGTYTLSSIGSNDIFVSKLDASGNFVWAKAMGGPGLDHGACLYVDINGNVYTTGYFNGNADFNPGPGAYNLNSAAGSDIFISKLDSAGNFVWAKQIGGADTAAGNGITVDTNGNIYVTGYFKGTADFDPGIGTYNLTSAGAEDIFICKLDTSGNFIWAKQMGSTQYDVGNAIIVDAGNVYTIGAFSDTVDFDPGTGIYDLTSAGVQDIFISTLDINGNFVSAADMGGPSTEIGTSLAITSNGDVNATGWFFGTADFDPGPNTYNLVSAGACDVYVVKLSNISSGTGETENQSNNIFFSPNPATSEFKIQNAEFKIEKVEMYNVLGEKVFSQPVTGNQKQVTIRVADFSPGIYFVRLSSNKDRVVKKVIVQR